jgi:DNA-binding cell septation regulator SpoVG
MPQDQGRDGKWYDTFYPVSKEFRAGLEKMILDEYNGQK